MPVTPTAAFAQSVSTSSCQINPADYTILKQVFTAGENGSLIDFISMSTSDTSGRDIQFWITKLRPQLASCILTSTGVNVSNNDTVTIGSKVYTFQTTLTNVDGNVKIGASAALSLTNLINAITINAGTFGTDFALNMTQHPSVTAATISNTQMLVMANVAGGAGNSIATTDVAATLSWATSTLTNGLDSTTVDILLATLNLPANSGFTSSIPIVSALDHARFGSSTGLPILDPNGNKLLRLEPGEILRAKSLSTITAGKAVYIRASGADL